MDVARESTLLWYGDDCLARLEERPRLGDDAERQAGPRGDAGSSPIGA
jgi:hypothetical protein